MGSRYPLRLSRNIGNNTLKQGEENEGVQKKFSQFRGHVRVAARRSTLTGAQRFDPPPRALAELAEIMLAERLAGDPERPGDALVAQVEGEEEAHFLAVFCGRHVRWAAAFAEVGRNRIAQKVILCPSSTAGFLAH